MPVAHAALRYSTPAGEVAARESVCWWGEMTFVPHVVGLMRLPYVEASVQFGDERIAEGDRKVLARCLWERVRADLAALDRPAGG